MSLGITSTQKLCTDGCKSICTGVFLQPPILEPVEIFVIYTRITENQQWTLAVELRKHWRSR
jgi:hypothetical protein